MLEWFKLKASFPAGKGGVTISLMGNKESEMNDKGSFVISILKVGKPNKYTNGYELMYK